MLAISWLVCGYFIATFSVGFRLSERVAMGVIALALLLAAETILGAVGFGRSLAEQLVAYRQPGPAMGLAAQLAFAAFPTIQRRPAAT